MWATLLGGQRVRMWGVCGAIPAPHGPTLGKDPAQGMLCHGPDPWWGQRLPGAGGISEVTLQGHVPALLRVKWMSTSQGPCGGWRGAHSSLQGLMAAGRMAVTQQGTPLGRSPGRRLEHIRGAHLVPRELGQTGTPD